MNQSLVNKLIKRYELSIALCKYMPLFIAKLILICLGTVKGICACASYIYDEFIYCDTFVVKHCTRTDAYWYPTPRFAKNKKELLERLQYRIDILKTYNNK